MILRIEAEDYFLKKLVIISGINMVESMYIHSSDIGNKHVFLKIHFISQV